MFLLKLNEKENVKLTVQKEMQIWIARNHIETKQKEKKISLAFSKKDIEPGDAIIISGTGDVYYEEEGRFYHARIYNIGINVDRYAPKEDQAKRNAVYKILPFQCEISNGLLVATPEKSSIHDVVPVRTKLIKAETRENMLRNAELIPTTISGEYQQIF